MSSYKPLPKHKPHDVIPSEEWNIISDDLEYLKSKIEEALVGKVKPSDLDAIDSPANGEVPTYNAAQGKFEWKPMAGGGAVTVEEVLNKRFRGGALVKVFNHFLPKNMFHHGTYGGTIEYSTDYVRPITEAKVGYWAAFYSYWYHSLYLPTWEKKKRVFFSIALYSDFDQIMHFVTGYVDSYTSADNPAVHVGFKIIDNTIYGTVGNYLGESTINLGTFTASVYSPAPLFLEAIFDPTAGKCEFYVNDEYKGELTEYLPPYPGYPIAGAEQAFEVSVSPTADIERYVYIMEIGVIQYP